MSVKIQCNSRLNLKTERLIERLENNRGGKEWAIMSVKIQCKSRLNLKTERLLERLENNRGGKEWAGPVFPHPLFRRIIC